ncbi:hypothetical protein TNCV_204851 [Trichonephila clavipes]|nr:hypothetical protein TNCV_204851 [Trichonephila clavipes]
MGCGLVINHCKPSTFPGSWYLFLVFHHICGYQSPQIKSYDMADVNFLPHKNPPTLSGVEAATLGAEVQRQTNNATPPGLFATRITLQGL